MKYISKLISCTLVGIIAVTSCDTDQLHDLNVNPQALKTIDLNFLFTSAQLGAASAGSSGDNRYIDWRTNIGMCAHAIQQLANAGGGIAPGDKYEDNFETAEAPFQFMYMDQLKNLNEILRQTDVGGYDEGNKPNLRNATRILRVFLFHRLTDYYGSIPYFEALKSADKLFFPAYDKQQAVYTDLLNELDLATAALGAADPSDGFAAADLYYQGDIAKWKKWGYSLMLRLALRVSTVNAAMAGTYITKAVAGGVFTSNSDNVWVPMAIIPSLWTNQNGISRAFFPGDGGQPTFLSNTFINWLKGPLTASVADDDPRLMIFSGGIGALVATGDNLSMAPGSNLDPLDQKGMPNGKNQSMLDILEGHPVNQDDEYSKMNYKFLQRDEPYMLMNYGEVEFYLAEAAERGLGGVSGATAHYNAGVKASMQMYTPYDASLTVSDAAVTAYLTTYAYGVAKPELEMIGEQIWANHFLNWWEAWSDWRRTGFPTLVPTNFPGNVTGGTIPQRLKYPNSEVGSNPNFEAGSTKPNNYMTKVWWAGGPE
jgi:Starch-binding associating with outer membrane